MVAPRVPDLTSGNFLVEISGLEPMVLTAVSGIGFEVAVIEDPETKGGPNAAPHRSPGVERHGVVMLSTMELEKAAQLGAWRNEVEAGTINRKLVTIVMLDSAGLPVQEFTLMDAWPSSIAIQSVPQAGEGWVQVDVTLAHEGIERKRR